MARLWCRALLIGSTVGIDAVCGAGKKAEQAAQGEVVVLPVGPRIGVWGASSGLDDDSPFSQRTVDFCIEAKVTMAIFVLLTPYSGTRLSTSVSRPRTASPRTPGG